MDDFDLRCINCCEFHEYGQWQCYDQGWEHQPRSSWKVGEDFNPWNPPIHQYYEDFDNQSIEQESGKINLEEIMGKLAQNQANLAKHQVCFMNETRNRIKNLEIQLEQISRQNMAEFQDSCTTNIAVSPVEQCEELQSEEGDS